MRRVQVEIINRDNNRYLQDDLTTWGAANTINATLAIARRHLDRLVAAADAHRQPASCRCRPRPSPSTARSDATKAIKKFETFGLADQTPDAPASAGPAGSVIPTTTFIVTGTASDDFGVNSITYTFRDAQNRYLQDDGTTDADLQHLPRHARRDRRHERHLVATR